MRQIVLLLHLILESFSNDITAIAEFDLQVYDYSSLQSLKYRIKPYGSIWQDWNDLDKDEETVAFGWDSTNTKMVNVF